MRHSCKRTLQMAIVLMLAALSHVSRSEGLVLSQNYCNLAKAELLGATTSTLMQEAISPYCDGYHYADTPFLVDTLLEYRTTKSLEWAMKYPSLPPVNDTESSYALAAYTIQYLHELPGTVGQHEYAWWIEQFRYRVVELATRGAIDAPDLSKYAPAFDSKLDDESLRELKELLGREVIDTTGTLDRQRARALILVLHAYVNQTGDKQMLEALYQRDVGGKILVFKVLENLHVTSTLMPYAIACVKKLEAELGAQGQRRLPFYVGPQQQATRFLQAASINPAVSDYVAELLNRDGGAFATLHFERDMYFAAAYYAKRFPDENRSVRRLLDRRLAETEELSATLTRLGYVRRQTSEQ